MKLIFDMKVIKNNLKTTVPFFHINIILPQYFERSSPETRWIDKEK